MAEVTMPRLSDTMSEGTVGRWLKKPGDKIEVGEIIAEIETDKATMELESYDKGILQQIIIPEGRLVPIGEIIAIIGDQALSEEALASMSTPTQSTAPSTTVADPTLPALRDNGHTTTDERLKVSPVARRIAAEIGVDLRQIQGTGPGGRILKENVETFIQKQAPSKTDIATKSMPPAPTRETEPTPLHPPTNAKVVTMGRMRRAISRTMTIAKPGTPHIYITLEVDMSEALKLREQINKSGTTSDKISVNDMVVKAAAKALLKFPILNSSYATTADNQPGIIHHQQINIGVAVAIEDGLLAPVVFDADKKSIGTISAEIKDLAKRARDNKIKQNELEGGTFQVSNLGMFDVVEFVSIITPPQAASLAVSAVREVPVVRDRQVVVGEIMNITISADHRVTDGATAAKYMKEVKRLLQAPMSLLL